MANMENRFVKKLRKIFYRNLDKIFLKWDKARILRSQNIKLIPNVADRVGGKHSYAEWAHVIGIFQTLIYYTLVHKESNQILDIGCGKGLLGIAAYPFVQNGGAYRGIDVGDGQIEYCREQYTWDNYSFYHHKVFNAAYAKDQDQRFVPWSVEDGSVDLVTALSVWTHMTEEDAINYFKEIDRVLKPDGKAIVTFFYLDDIYSKNVSKKSKGVSKYYNTQKDNWIFDSAIPGSENWSTTSWASNPEDAIAINQNGMQQLLEGTRLKIRTHHPGSWKEIPGLYFQDVFIFKKE